MRNVINVMNNPNGPVQSMGKMAAVLAGVGLTGYSIYSSLFSVDGGHRAVMFNRILGVKDTVYREGIHVRVPWFDHPTIFDIRTRPKVIRSPTGTKDLQMVDITLRVLYRPNEVALPKIFSQLGTNYDERVLPSIVNEVLKSVVARFNANQLITKREEVSNLIRGYLTERAMRFNIIVDDVSITHLNFSQDYTSAVEAKQVAQQEAERAKYVVDRATQEKKSVVIKAEGEAQSAMLLSHLKDNPMYLKLREIEAATHIAHTISAAKNTVYVNSDMLLLNTIGEKPAIKTKQ